MHMRVWEAVVYRITGNSKYLLTDISLSRLRERTQNIQIWTLTKELKNGVKDIEFDMQAQTVTVTYDANKTDIPTLQKAFAKIGKPATTQAPEHEHGDDCKHDHHHAH